MPNRPWPTAVDTILDRPDEQIEVVGTDRWAVGSRRVSDLGASDAAANHERFLVDLADRAPFAAPVVLGRDGRWLVTETPSGLPADRPERHPEPGNLARLIGEGLAALHAMAPIDPPGEDDSWAPIVERCQHSVAAGLVDPASLPAPYDRYQPDRLLEMLIDGGAASSRPSEPGVLCHGAPEAGRFLIDGDRFIGFDAIDAPLVADRHLDLAVAHLSVSDALGAEAVYGFYEGYGTDPDLARLDRAILARHLLLAPSQPR